VVSENFFHSSWKSFAGFQIISLPPYFTFTHVLFPFLLILCLFITYLFIEIKQNELKKKKKKKKKKKRNEVLCKAHNDHHV